MIFKMRICRKILLKNNYLNDLENDKDNYFSEHFGGTYFSEENARKIGIIREVMENITDSEYEKNILICSLLYAVDKVANTVGHYDAFRKKFDAKNPSNGYGVEVDTYWYWYDKWIAFVITKISKQRMKK